MASVNLPLPFEGYKGTEPYVFVSYAHKDGAIVYPQLTALHEAGYRVWYDEGIDPGNEWPDEIAQALQNAAWFLVILTGNAVSSRNVRNEINYALNLSKPFLAIHVEEMQLPPGLELRMGDIQAILKWRMTDDHYRRKLFKTLPESLRDTTSSCKAEEERPQQAAAAELARQATERRERERAADAAAKAARAKAEQEALARPSIRFVAVLDEREVRGAKVSYGADTWETPIVLNLTQGGAYLFTFRHTDAAGREYVGEAQVAATWSGEQTQRIALAPKRSQAAVAGLSPQNDALALDLGGGVALDCVLIRPGAFIMGSDKGEDREKPAHKVRLTKPFYMGKFAVTQEQWEKVMGANPSNFKGVKLPVEGVNWDDCQEFLAKLKAKVPGTDFRLPTEAQWEYACRAGTTTEYSFGDSDASLGDYALYDGNSENKTHEVGQKKPNAWGLFDMHGNVWEWCSDWYGAYTAAEAVDPAGPSSGSYRVLRGGSWLDYAVGCRSAYRGDDEPSYRNDGIGLRLVVVPR